MYFKLIKSILDQQISAVASDRGLSEKEVEQQVGAYLESMSKEWFSGKKPTIAFDDPICRLGYLFAHVPVHANLFEDVFSVVRDRVGDDEELRVLVFGGGPGTELLGMAKYFFDADESVDVSIDIVDRVTAWNESINWIKEEIRRRYKKKHGKPPKWPARFDITNYTLDFSDIKQFGNISSIFKKDMFVFCFVFSEIFEMKTIMPILKQMVAAAPTGAGFLIIDRSDDTTQSRIADILTKLKLKNIDPTSTSTNMSADEQASILDNYKKKFGRGPRVRWDACWIFAEK